MPMYDFKCPNCGHVEEYFLSQSQDVDTFQPFCSMCEGQGKKEVAFYTPSFWYNSATNAQRFPPTVIHRDAQGNIRFVMNADAPVPEGFEKVELRTVQDIRKLENEVNGRESSKATEHHYNQIRDLENQIRRTRDALVVNEQTGEVMGSMQDLVNKFSPKGRRFYEAMREASEIRLKQFRDRVPSSPNFHVEAFSMDASNRDAGHDPNLGRMKK